VDLSVTIYITVSSDYHPEMSQPGGHSCGTDYPRIARRIPLAAFIALSFAASTYADDLHQIFVSPGFNNPQNVYNAWTPLRLTLTNRSDRDPTTQLVIAEVPGPNGPFDIQIAVFFDRTARATVADYLCCAAIFVLPVFPYLASGAQISPTLAAWLGLSSPLVIALNLMPGGLPDVRTIWLVHLIVIGVLCIFLLLVSRYRLTVLMRRGV
jgi:hypothetical protein